MLRVMLTDTRHNKKQLLACEITQYFFEYSSQAAHYTCFSHKFLLPVGLKSLGSPCIVVKTNVWFVPWYFLFSVGRKGLFNKPPNTAPCISPTINRHGPWIFSVLRRSVLRDIPCFQVLYSNTQWHPFKVPGREESKKANSFGDTNIDFSVR